MRNRHNSSPISAPCRLEWRPSRWLSGALLLLGTLAPLAITHSEMPTAAMWAAAPAAALAALVLVAREYRRPRRTLVIPRGERPAHVDGEAITALQLQCRGPLTVLSWCDLRRRRQLLFWPDTLTRLQRRELRLVLEARRVSQLPRQVAP
ncbi:hypothetical protein [Stenotrophomonas sp. YIM B06876]|uniref:hypothetical protein n=1 Tax=Stenotrophomonas sp. YIM B06876 TaxID=3060211 RepID=UPI0027385262|nr:hypothetical protein [Stenotrophomonas sp. YIM B06876]